MIRKHANIKSVSKEFKCMFSGHRLQKGHPQKLLANISKRTLSWLTVVNKKMKRKLEKSMPVAQLVCLI